MKLRIAGIKKESLVDGPGVCYVIFVQGCNHNCPGCHNPEAQPFDGGVEMEIGAIFEEIASLKGTDAVVFSGGEPFLQPVALSLLGKKIHHLGLKIITYTGFTLEQLLENSPQKRDCQKLLEVTDILIDGPYIEEQKDLELAFRGSKNQRIIDVKPSMKLKKAVVMSEL
ncbi:MAG: anaerobic ribonucleoside-triphosphate reductase activating protein [Firmicutes bacterium]|jgi:anaerobic ribonucleoside-triphosphate reductase activating protein|nr:anaerobic ribonucleoside-triphosphate reductase activating protein [Bacillota bacterium]